MRPGSRVQATGGNEFTGSLQVARVDDDLACSRDCPSVPSAGGEVEHAMHRLDAVGREQLTNQLCLGLVRDDRQADEVVGHGQIARIS